MERQVKVIGYSLAPEILQNLPQIFEFVGYYLSVFSSHPTTVKVWEDVWSEKVIDLQELQNELRTPNRKAFSLFDQITQVYLGEVLVEYSDMAA